jgi:hypothetical protein
MSHHCSQWATTAPNEPPLLPMSHHCSQWASTAPDEPPLLPMSHHCSQWATTAPNEPPLFPIQAYYPDCPLWLSWHDCPVPAFLFLDLLSCSGCLVPVILLLCPAQADLLGPPVQSDLSRLPCPSCSVSNVLSWLSCQGCPCQDWPILGRPVLVVQSLLSFSGLPVLSLFPTDLSLLLCPCGLIKADPSRLICQVDLSSLSCHGWPIRVVMSQMSCPNVLRQLSCPLSLIRISLIRLWLFTLMTLQIQILLY